MIINVKEQKVLIKTLITKKNLKIKKYTYFNKNYVRHERNRIQSKDYTVGTYNIEENSLSCYVNNKYVLQHGYHRLSYFDICIHYAHVKLIFCLA